MNTTDTQAIFPLGDKAPADHFVGTAKRSTTSFTHIANGPDSQLGTADWMEP